MTSPLLGPQYEPATGAKYGPVTVLAVASLATFLALLPLFGVAIPPLLDYPNHIARCFIADHYEQLSAYQTYYTPNPAFVPDLGLDVTVKWLSALMPTLTAGRVFVFSTELLTSFGVMALNRALFRRWSLWPVCVTLLLYNLPLDYGFLSYSFGVGLLLWAVAAHILLENRPLPVRAAATLASAVVLMIAHMIPFLLFGVIVLCYETARARKKPVRAVVTDLASTLAPLIGLAILFKTFSPAGSEWRYLQFCPIKERLFFWLNPLSSTTNRADTVFFLFLLLGAGALLANRAISIDRRMAWPLIGLLIVVIFAPEQGRSIAFVGARMPIVLLLFFVASFTFTGSKAAAVGVAATSGVLLAVRTAMIYQDWREKEAVTFAMQEDLARIKPGALMLITDSKPQGRQSYLAQAPPWQWHIPLLQLFRKPILAPTFFASPEGQPMLIRGKYAELKPFPTPLDVRTVDHELDRYFEGNPLARSFSQIAVVVNHYHDPVQVATMQGETINRRDYSLVLLAGGRGR